MIVRVAAALALALPASAHDHWLEPSSFAPARGERLDLHLCVGHPASFEEQARDPRRIERFELLGPAGARAVVGLDGRAPAGFLVPREEGLSTFVYVSTHSFVEIEPATYARYLADEGLDDVAAERARRGESALPGRDSYLRCDKALVRVGHGPADTDRSLGLPVELVAEGDPFAWTPGTPLVLRLELAGRPLPGRQVKLMSLEEPFTILLARTDGEGRARFAPPRAGGWVASAVHQRRVTPEQGLEGDWEGLWASLAFPLGAPGGS